MVYASMLNLFSLYQNLCTAWPYQALAKANFLLVTATFVSQLPSAIVRNTININSTQTQVFMVLLYFSVRVAILKWVFILWIRSLTFWIIKSGVILKFFPIFLIAITEKTLQLRLKLSFSSPNAVWLMSGQRAKLTSECPNKTLCLALIRYHFGYWNIFNVNEILRDI